MQNSKVKSQNYNSKFKNFAVILVSCFLLLASFQAVFAQGLVPCGGIGQRPCTICDFGVLIINITNFLIYNIAIPLAGLMIVVGGVMIMVGSASETRVAAGKKILTNAIIGIVIVFVAWLFVDTTIKVLTGGWQGFANFGPWNRIPSSVCPFDGGVTSATLPIPSVQTRPPTVSTAEILRDETSPGRLPPPDTIFDDVNITTNPVTNKVTVEDISTSKKSEFDVQKEGAGIAYVREKYPNVFIIGGDLSIQDAVKLREALDRTYAKLPDDYRNLKDSYILVPANSEIHDQMVLAAGYDPKEFSGGRSLVGEGNTMVVGTIAGGYRQGLEEILTHELAHQRDKVVNGDYGGDLEWQDLNIESIKAGAFVSNYAKTNFAEDLAETITVASNPRAQHWTGDPAKDAVLKQKYEYLKRKGFIKQVPSAGVGLIYPHWQLAHSRPFAVK